MPKNGDVDYTVYLKLIVYNIHLFSILETGSFQWIDWHV